MNIKFSSIFGDSTIDGYNVPFKYNHWRRDEDPWTFDHLTYAPLVYPLRITNKETGEITEAISFDVPGCSPKDIKVSFNKETWTLTLTGNSGESNTNRSYTFSINTFSKDLLIETLETTVSNGVAVVSGKLRNKKAKDKEEEVSIPVR